MSLNREDLSATITRPLAYDGSKSPAKSLLFLVLCAAYVLPGLIGRDPWKPDEATAFGPIYAILRGEGWLIPMLAGAPWFDHPPLYNWLAVIHAKALGGLFPPHDAARLASGTCMAIASVCLLLTANELNGERAGRLAVIVFLGSVGLVLRAHEINPDLAGLMGFSAALYGMTVVRRRAARGAIFTTLGIAAAGLGSGWILAGAAAICAVALPTLSIHWQGAHVKRTLWLSIAVASLLIALWPLALVMTGTPAAQWLQTASGIPWLGSTGMRRVNLLYFALLLPWYALPAWPVAALTLWQERKRVLSNMEFKFPLTVLVVLLLVMSVAMEPREIRAAPLLLPLALLAVPAIDRLRRSAVGLLDWFGIMIFLWLCALVWAGWLGYTTGIPTGAARWVAARVPGYEHEMRPLVVAIAVILTLVWIGAALRARSSNRRALVNWTAGLTTMWLLVNTLWIGAMDHVRSYRSVTSAVTSRLPATSCVAQLGLGSAQVAGFDYYANLRFVDGQSTQAHACKALLVQSTVGAPPAVGQDWQLVWQGARPGEGLLLRGSKDAGSAERFWLYSK